MNRRDLLITGAAASLAPVAALAHEEHDEFRDLVQAMIDGDAAYIADPLAGTLTGAATRELEEEIIERTYGPPMRRLQAGNLPAPRSNKAVALGLRYCLNADLLCGAEGEAIIIASLAYLETSGTSA